MALTRKRKDATATVKLRCVECSYRTFKPGEVYELEKTTTTAGRFTQYLYRVPGETGYFIVALDDDLMVSTESSHVRFEEV